MKSFNFLLVAALHALLFVGIMASASAAGPELPLSMLVAREQIGSRVELFEDAGKQHTLQSLKSVPDNSWKHSETAVINFSFSKSTWWLRFSLINDTPHAETRLIEVAQPIQDYVSWYLKINDVDQPVVNTGDRLPFGDRIIPYRSPVFPVRLEAGQRAEVLMRLDTHDGYFSALPLFINSEAAFLSETNNQTLLFGIFFGGMGALLLYNLLLFASTREPMFLGYVLYLGTFWLWNFTFQGLAFEYWWPQSPILNNITLASVGILCYLAIAYFATIFLQLRKNSPRLLKLIIAISIPIVGLFLLSLANVYQVVFRYGQPLLTLLVLVVFFTAARLAWRGQRTARLFVVAWGMFLLGLAIFSLRIFGVIATNAFTANVLYIGSSIEFILLAFALADRINTLKYEKLTLERKTLAIERAHRQELEQRVIERTEALSIANAQLQELAIHDALTGLFNRRHFNTLCVEELSRARRTQHALGLVMLDIDYFKRFNDSLGHQAGDEALRAVAQILQDSLRRPADYVFRVGGEEFAILVSDTTAEGLAALAENLVSAVRSLQMPHPAHPLGVITISAGSAFSRADDDTRQLYARADAALYAAKAAGRNRHQQNGAG